MTVYHATSGTALTLSQRINTFASIPTRSPGWPGRTRACWRRGTLPSSLVTGLYTSKPVPTRREASMKQSQTTRERLKNTWTAIKASRSGRGTDPLLCPVWGGITRGSWILSWYHQKSHLHSGGAQCEVHAVCCQTSEGSWTWWHLRTCTEGLCRQTGWGLHENIHPVPVLVGCPTLLEVVCHRLSAQKINHYQFQWLQASSFDPCGDEVLIRNHIMSFISTTFNPYQFAYRDNRSTDDAVATALHAVLSHWPHSTCLWAMSPPTGMRWSIWQCGVEKTTCSWTLQKPRGLLWT